MASLRPIYILAVLCIALLGHCCDKPLIHTSDQSSNLFSELAAELSPDAAIVSPDLAEHQRWSAYASPTYAVVVEVATEEDVQKTVLFANKHCLPFLAVDGAHGAVPSLAAMQSGVAISFVKMKDIDIDHSGEYAELEPGLTNGELVRALWAQGKQASTGVCQCAGLTGLMLGGGHGYLQGFYGLTTDQILEARVVLADGSVVTASPKKNSDLFWALRGAGHNFGILTSFKFRIHPRLEEWSVIHMVFPENKLEALFELSNGYIREADHPPELVFVLQGFMRMPDLSDNTVIQLHLVYQGPLAYLERYAAPFRFLRPLVEDRYDGLSYPELFDINGLSESTKATCGKGLYRHLTPTYLMRHNATSLREVYTIFNDITAKYPDIAPTSMYMIEGYPIQGVKAVPSRSSAKPFRWFPLLLSPAFGYANAEYSDEIITAAREMRRALVEGSGSDLLYGYVNYALGDETLPELYGHDPWRLRKLRALKEKYDPGGAFNFYMPIHD